MFLLTKVLFLKRDCHSLCCSGGPRSGHQVPTYMGFRVKPRHGISVPRPILVLSPFHLSLVPLLGFRNSRGEVTYRGKRRTKEKRSRERGSPLLSPSWDRQIGFGGAYLVSKRSKRGQQSTNAVHHTPHKHYLPPPPPRESLAFSTIAARFLLFSRQVG